MSRPGGGPVPLPNQEVLTAAAHRAANQVSRATVNIMSIQDLARGFVTWVSRFATRERKARAQRSKSSADLKSEGVIAHYCHEAQDIAQFACNDIKVSAKEMYEEVTQDVMDLSPLPPKFDYSYALVSYAWLFLIMTSKTLGHRLARVELVYGLLEAIFSRWVAAILLYILLPTYTILINQKINEETLDRNMRRAVIIALAFVYGLFGEFVWLHWIHFNVSAPYYYYPAIIGAMLQLVGPHLSHDRRLLLGACISSAVTVSLTIAANNGVLTIYYACATIVSAASSLLNLQLLIADLRKHGSDEFSMICGHYRALVVSTYSHGFLTAICARYNSEAINEADTAVE